MRQILHAAGADELLSIPVMLAGTAASVQLLGTFSGTVTFEVSVTGEEDEFVAVGLTPAAGTAVVTTATAPGVWHFEPRLLAGTFRLHVTSWVSGAIDGYFVGSPS